MHQTGLATWRNRYQILLFHIGRHSRSFDGRKVGGRKRELRRGRGERDGEEEERKSNYERDQTCESGSGSETERAIRGDRKKEQVRNRWENSQPYFRPSSSFAVLFWRKWSKIDSGYSTTSSYACFPSLSFLFPSLELPTSIPSPSHELPNSIPIILSNLFALHTLLTLFPRLHLPIYPLRYLGPNASLSRPSMMRSPNWTL